MNKITINRQKKIKEEIQDYQEFMEFVHEQSEKNIDIDELFEYLETEEMIKTKTLLKSNKSST